MFLPCFTSMFSSEEVSPLFINARSKKMLFAELILYWSWTFGLVGLAVCLNMFCEVRLKCGCLFAWLLCDIKIEGKYVVNFQPIIF